MWLTSVLRDKTHGFRSCAFANTLKNPAGMRKNIQGCNSEKYFHDDSA